MAEHNSVERVLDLPQQPLSAVIDEDSLQQVITNLAINAVQAMPRGGRLGVTLVRAPSVSRDGGPPRDRVRLDVRDSGPGIPPDVLPNIFEPFFTTKQPGDGTGLGLAVVYGIVDDHGGWISVDTGAHGTTFSVYLAEAR
jgi:signal transduction histidine kinase